MVGSKAAEGDGALGRRQILEGALGVLLAPAAASFSAQAQTGYPSRPITVVSPFSPGGLNDTCSRAVARGLQDAFGQSVVVENRPGANTLIGLEQVARSAPDGHMLVTVSDANMTYMPGLVSRLSFSLEKDFAPITLLSIVPLLLIVRSGLDVASAEDLIRLAKANPGKLSFSSAGVTSAPRMAGELFQWMSGTKMVHVPYKGATPAITDVMAGHVDLMFADAGSAGALVRAGKVRAIGISTARRSPLFPDIPPIAETGLPDFEAKLWIGMATRAGTPPDIVQRLNREIVASMQRPEVGGVIASQGVELMTNSPEEFARMIEADRARFAQVIKTTGIKLEE
jgi:tripartite-type tricarboxylate transporter receptor subunit TctC